MSLDFTKVTYIDGSTVIGADNLNDIQDAILELDLSVDNSIASINEQISDLEQTTTATTVGPVPIATFDASAADMPLKQVVVNIEPVQSGTGDPSPENVRPITGWTGCNVLNHGEQTITWTNGAYIAADGTVTSGSGLRYSSLIPVTAGNWQCKVEHISTSSRGLRIHAYDKDGNWLEQVAYVQIATPGEYTANFTISDPDEVYIRISMGSTNYTTFLYVAFAYPITFPSPDPGTVYGGTLDVVNKKLTVTHIKVESSQMSWGVAQNATYADFYAFLSGGGPVKGANIAISNKYKFWGVGTSAALKANLADCEFGSQNNNTLVRVRDDSFNGDLAAFQAANTDLYFVAELNAPVTYNLSDVPEVTTLLGTNNIWADCGDVTVTYGVYLEMLKASLDRTKGELGTLRACIAPIEDGATASQAYAAGAYFFRNGSFCTALTSIASGAAFTLGTNYQVTTVAAALIALQS